MNWLSVLSTTFHYLAVPFTTLFWWTIACLAPVLHLGSYILSGCLLPLRLLAKFETLYIYLGVAAVIGLITGSILHLSSSVLISVFNLTAVSEERERSAASVRAAREQKKLEQAWQNSTGKGENANDPAMEKFAEWLEKGDQGLAGQTILEEDDSDMF